MAIEDALIAQARPFILSAQIRSLTGSEILKGCSAELQPFAVALEPRFCALAQLMDAGVVECSDAVAAKESNPRDWIRLRVWISPDQPFNWHRCESFLKSLTTLSHLLGFEISGNRERIDVFLLCHCQDRPIIEAAFAGQFDCCRLMTGEPGLLESLATESLPIWFNDYYPLPPYFHRFTSFEELRFSPFETLLSALDGIPSPAVGFYQCLWEPTDQTHNWHRNIETLHDLHYAQRLQSGFTDAQRYPQQAPSGDLRSTSQEVQLKAHNDKPIFAAAVRLGVINHASPALLGALATSMNAFQHGGRALRCLNQDDYWFADTLRMISQGKVYRPGFLINSRELTGFVHLFSTKILENRQVGLRTLETLPVKNVRITTGTMIGVSHFGDRMDPVCIPQQVREHGTHLLASSGMGKSTVMQQMFLQDVSTNKGAVFIDAHGDSIRQLLTLIPPDRQDDCIMFDPGDPHRIPLWNPLHVAAGCDRYRMADDLLSALERVSKDWGDRLAHVLRNGLIGLSYLPQATMLDLYHLVRQKSPESEVLRKQIVELAVDEPVKKFWERDFLKDYREADLASPKHKLHKLIAGGSVSLMLSQPKAEIEFRRVMDEGKILLVDLSTIGGESREVLGSLILTLFMMAAISRSDTDPKKRRAFSIFADEAHLFISADAIENLITQARKFGVNLCLAHQYLKQFKTAQVDALSTVGCTILGRLDKRDSQYFVKDLMDLVAPSDLLRLERYEMIARIGTDVVRLRTIPCSDAANAGSASTIVSQTHTHYCARADDIRNSLARKGDPEPLVTLNFDIEEFGFTEADLAYDEF